MSGYSLSITTVAPARKMAHWALLASAAVLATPMGSASTSQVRVVDGDTLVVRGTKVRLAAVDAPELHQTCGQEFTCGQQAKDALAKAIAERGGDVLCSSKGGPDRYGRTVASCRFSTSRFQRFGNPWTDRKDGEEDVGAWMVSHGWARAYPQYGGQQYAGLEEEARRKKAGAWEGEFQPPWEWRRTHNAGRKNEATHTTQSSPSKGMPVPACAIKGNVNARGEKIYHLPDGPYYDQVVIKLEEGDFWLCTEQEATKRGFRPIRRS